MLKQAPGLVEVLFGVFTHTLDINDHHRFVADDPGVVARGIMEISPGPQFLPAAIVHHNGNVPGNVILQVGRFAAFCVHQRLERGGPLPTGVEGGASEVTPPRVVS